MTDWNDYHRARDAEELAGRLGFRFAYGRNGGIELYTLPDGVWAEDTRLVTFATFEEAALWLDGYAKCTDYYTLGLKLPRRPSRGLQMLGADSGCKAWMGRPVEELTLEDWREVIGHLSSEVKRGGLTRNNAADALVSFSVQLNTVRAELDRLLYPNSGMAASPAV
jgi:hypothetical protein